MSVKIGLAVLCIQIASCAMVEGKPNPANYNAGNRPEDYLILTRTLCQSQTAKDTKEFNVVGVKDCYIKCDNDPECKAISFDATAHKCRLKIACDKPVHDLNFVSYISTKTLKGKALPRHYVLSNLNDKVLTVGSKLDGDSYALSFEDKKSPVDQSQQFYAEKFGTTTYFYIRWDGNIKLVVGIDHESTDPGATIVLSPNEALKPKFTQLWTWRKRTIGTLESKSKEKLVLQINDDVNPVTADFKKDKENQQFTFES